MKIIPASQWRNIIVPLHHGGGGGGGREGEREGEEEGKGGEGGEREWRHVHVRKKLESETVTVV